MGHVFHIVEENPSLRLFGNMNSAAVHLNEPKPKIDPASASPVKEKNLKNSSVIVTEGKKPSVEAPKSTGEVTKPNEQKKVTFEDSNPKQDLPKQADEGKKVDGPNKAEDAPKKSEDAPKKTEDAPKKPAENKPKTEATKQDTPQDKTKEAEPKKPDQPPANPQKKEAEPTKPSNDQQKKPDEPANTKKPEDSKPLDPQKQPKTSNDSNKQNTQQPPTNPADKQPNTNTTQTTTPKDLDKHQTKKPDLNTSIDEAVPQDMTESKVLGFSKSTFKPSVSFTVDSTSTVEGDKKHEWKGTAR